MNVTELEKMYDEGVDSLPSLERRTFLRAGLAITGLFMGGMILSLTSARSAQGAIGSMPKSETTFPTSHIIAWSCGRTFASTASCAWRLA